MGKISFKSLRQEVAFHNPSMDGQLDRQEIELRFDPLTGHQSILSGALEGKLSILFPETDYGYFQQRVENTRDQCFLCDGKWRQTTPRYPESLLPGGRLTKGEIVLFPNLFSLAPYHAVVMIGEKHGRTLNDFPPDLLYDAFSVSLEFIRKCFSLDPEARYFTINVNVMFPAGGSAVHPHLQILGSSFPTTHHRLLLQQSLVYYNENQSCYWLDLIETEKKTGQRWLGEIGESCWFTAYSPIGVNEINAVWPKASHFLEWTDQDIQTFAEGLHRAYGTYHDLKFSTCNYSCFSGPLGQDCPEFRCFLRLINRQNMNLHYRADDYFLQKLLQNEIMIYRPERLASLMKERFDH
jgi:UDPglucose--hexose-1-phosphate uridylyltransferase